VQHLIVLHVTVLEVSTFVKQLVSFLPASAIFKAYYMVFALLQNILKIFIALAKKIGSISLTSAVKPACIDSEARLFTQ